ncbi:MAG: magnesium transporter [Promethearchaeota archaeon]|jgi:mgtE-like transporter
MEARDTKGKIVKETFPSETVSIVGDLLAGIVLSLLIISFKSFPLLILIIPALLSLRGNLSAPFIARTSRDLIIGEFNKRSWFENVLATLSLSLLTALAIGAFSILINFLLINLYLFNLVLLIIIPVISIILTLSVSIPCSTLLNYLAFKRGLDPNNVVNPIMTAIDDFFTVICFYLTIIILGVP